MHFVRPVTHLVPYLNTGKIKKLTRAHACENNLDGKGYEV